MRVMTYMVMGGLLCSLTVVNGRATTTRTVSGMSIKAEWREDGRDWKASGRARVGGLNFKEVELRERDGELTGVVEDWELELFDGCTLVTGQAAFGVASAQLIRDDVQDAPVVEGESYLYFDGSEGTELDCAGLLLPLSDGNQSRFYVNPDDPSIYVQASDILPGSTKAAISAATRRVMPVDIGEIGFGVSSRGLIPWKASERNAKGSRPSMDANLTLRGDVAVSAGKIRLAVRDGAQAYAFDLKKGSFEQACSSGAIVYPGFFMPGLGQLDLPLGKGVACYSTKGVELSTTLGGNAWDGLGLPSQLLSALEHVDNDERTLGGVIDINEQVVALRMGGTFPFGPLEVDGALMVGDRGMTIRGTSDLAVGPLDFGDLNATVDFPGKDFSAVAQGKAKLGFAGAQMDSTFVLGPSGMSGSGKAKLWGWDLKGDLEFDGYRFREAQLSTRFDVKAASGRLNLTVNSNKVSVKVKGCALGESFDAKVDSKGCFKVAGTKYCL